MIKSGGKFLLLALLSQSAMGQGISLGEAIDSPELEWNETVGSVAFSPMVSLEAIGQDIAGASLDQGQFAEVSTILPTSGIIDFWILGGRKDHWSAFVNGESLDLSGGSWPYGFRVDGEGPHTFRIRYVAEVNEASISVDGVIFRPDASVALAEALDTSGQTWSSSDATQWVGSPYFSYDGEDAAWIGGLAEEEVSSLKTTIEGPAEFSFWWRRTKGSATKGEFFINGERVWLASSPRQERWAQITQTVGAGSHELEWRAVGETPWMESPARGLWVDQFTVAPLAEGVLANFGSPLPGAGLRGEISRVNPGAQAGSSAIAMNIEYCEGDGLVWPIPVSQRPRKISFFHRNTDHGTVWLGGSSVRFASGDSWEKLAIPIPPGTSSFSVAAAGDLALLDQFKIEDLPVIPASEVIGPIANQLSLDGWLGWPEGSDTSEPALVSTSFDSSISGVLTGPAWLRFAGSAVGNGLLVVSVDGERVSVMASGESRYLIPSGSHQVDITHLKNWDSFSLSGTGSQALAMIKTLSVEPLSASPVDEPGGLQFTQSGSTLDPDEITLSPISWQPFFRDSEGEINAVAGPGQRLELATEVVGPAFLTFERKIEAFQANQPEIAGYRPSCTTGTIITSVGPGPGDPGTSLRVNGLGAFFNGTSGFLNIFEGPKFAPAEPFDSANPLYLSSSGPVSLLREVGLGQRTLSRREGWESFRLFLGPGSHQLVWVVGAPNNDVFGYFAQWKHLRLADIKITPIIGSYAEWAHHYWSADPEVENAVTKLGPWQDPEADPDRDGLSNALEFAYGTDPRSGQSRPPSHRVASAPKPVVYWAMPPENGPQVQWRFFHSDDLINWSEEGLSNRDTVNELSSELLAPAASAFFRLEADVTLPSE